MLCGDNRGVKCSIVECPINCRSARAVLPSIAANERECSDLLCEPTLNFLKTSSLQLVKLRAVKHCEPTIMSLATLHRTARVPSCAALAALESALASFRISSQTINSSGRRYASHQAQGRANGPKDSAGRRLGAKKADGQYVVPGNILFKQRGTLWFPGDGCFMACWL